MLFMSCRNGSPTSRRGSRRTNIYWTMHPSCYARRAIHVAFRGDSVRSGCVCALIIGANLNLINQGDVIFWNHPNKLAQDALTYLMPYVVSTWGRVLSNVEADDITQRFSFGQHRGSPVPGSSRPSGSLDQKTAKASLRLKTKVSEQRRDNEHDVIFALPLAAA